jgi:hypothetical protein
MQIKLSGGKLMIENNNGDSAAISYDKGFNIEIGDTQIQKPGEYEYKNIAFKASDMGIAKLAKINILNIHVDGFSIQIVPDTKDLRPEFEKDIEVSDLLFVTSETGDVKNIANIVDPYIVMTGKLGSITRVDDDGLKAIAPTNQTTKAIKLKEGELDSTAETRAISVYIIE